MNQNIQHKIQHNSQFITFYNKRSANRHFFKLNIFLNLSINEIHVYRVSIPLSVATCLSWLSEHLQCSLSLEGSLRTVAFIP